jgi:pyridinium-3,5-bisthiocarboxylic acid mononucleotide nickel chelatase
VRTLYFDCFSGASGDMILGALVDLGVPLEAVRKELDGLRLEGWDLTVEEVKRAGIRASRANVVIDPSDERRPYKEIVDAIEAAPLSPGVSARALRTFGSLARAEARVHGLDPDEVHFHEVGSLDAIIDIVGVSAALEHLGPDRIVTSSLAVGTGTTRGSHGPLPIPPPAVVELLAGTGAAIEQRGRGELLTPTGAALLASNSDEFGSLPAMELEATGYGAGTRDLEVPNVLRALWGESVDAPGRDDVVVIECNLDDMSPELLPHAIETLLGAGAQDAWVTPMVMKKGRPGFTLSVLASVADREVLTGILFEETSTLGLRILPAQKVVLEREWGEVDVDGVTVRVKIGLREGRVVTASPEYDDAIRAARATGLPLKEIYRRTLVEWAKKGAVRRP